MDYAEAPIASRGISPRGFFDPRVQQPILEQIADHSRMRVAGFFVALTGSMIHVQRWQSGSWPAFKSFVHIRKRNDLEV
jgi:hypothetical protein